MESLSIWLVDLPERCLFFPPVGLNEMIWLWSPDSFWFMAPWFQWSGRWTLLKRSAEPDKEAGRPPGSRCKENKKHWWSSLVRGGELVQGSFYFYLKEWCRIHFHGMNGTELEVLIQSNTFFFLHSGSRESAGASPSCQRAMAGWHPEQVANSFKRIHFRAIKTVVQQSVESGCCSSVLTASIENIFTWSLFPLIPNPDREVGGSSTRRRSGRGRRGSCCLWFLKNWKRIQHKMCHNQRAKASQQWQSGDAIGEERQGSITVSSGAAQKPKQPIRQNPSYKNPRRTAGREQREWTE